MSFSADFLIHMLYNHPYYLTYQSVLNTNLENDHARIMTSSKQIEGRVGS